MEQKIVIIGTILLSLLLLSSPVFANVDIRPAKLGIVRLTIQPLFSSISQGTFDIGDSYNFSLQVTLIPSQNISSIFSLSDTNFTLQPNETKTVSYTIKPTQAGVYQGNVLMKFVAGANQTSVGYQNDISIIVTQSNSYILVLAAVLIVVLIVAASVYVMKKKTKVRAK